MLWCLLGEPRGHPMFVRVKKIGSYEYLYLVENAREGGRHVQRAIYLTVVHRLMVSGSDRHASHWQRSFRLPGVAELTLDHAYKAMAWLGEEIGEGRWMTDAIEEALYRQRQDLFGEVSIAFFDTTSLYFEGAGGEKLGRRGHSKDYRP